LPGPVFAPPGGCLAYSASAPAALADGQWTFGTNQTSLVSGDITVSCDATEDRIRFDFADFDISAGTSDRVVEIYFAVTATTDPSEDGFEYANAAYFSYQDSSGATVATTLAGAGFISDTPNVVANFHNVTATGDTSGVITNGNLTGVDAGETVTFQTSLTNDGTGAAQDGILTLVWPAGLQPPSNPTACVEDSGTDCDYNVTDNGSCGAYDVTAADQTQLLVSNIDIAQGATCILTYQARVALSAQPAQLITTEAEYTWDNGGVTFSPVYDQATVTLRNPAITVTSITAPANPKPGDDIDVRVTITAIDGTSNSFLVDVVDNTFVTFDEASNSTLSMTLFTQTINATTYYCMINAATFVNNICFTNDPRSAANLTLVGGNLRVNFGQMVNGYADNTAQSVIFDLNNGIIDAAATSGNKTVRADYYWANPNGAGSLSVSSANSATAVYTPKLDVTKCVTAATTAAAPISMSEQVTYQVLMRNTGTFLQTAYDVANIVDTLTT
jgi:uncharacterized repeat protein (TIGR01451 family)